MTKPQGRPAFYRTGLVRWSFVGTGMYVAFALSPWGPHPWRDTPSLRFITHLFPLGFIAAFYAVYVLLLATNHLYLVIVAEILGLWLYAMALAALLITIRPDRPTNPIAVAAVVLAVVLHYAAARLAIIQSFMEMADDDDQEAT